MRTLYIEGLAIHGGPEPWCAGMTCGCRKLGFGWSSARGQRWGTVVKTAARSRRRVGGTSISCRPARGHERVKRTLRGILFSAGAVTRRGRIRG